MGIHRECRRPPSKGAIKGEMEEKNLNPVDNGGEGYTLGQRRPVGMSPGWDHRTVNVILKAIVV